MTAREILARAMISALHGAPVFSRLDGEEQAEAVEAAICALEAPFRSPASESHAMRIVRYGAHLAREWLRALNGGFDEFGEFTREEVEAWTRAGVVAAREMADAPGAPGWLARAHKTTIVASVRAIERVNGAPAPRREDNGPAYTDAPMDAQTLVERLVAATSMPPEVFFSRLRGRHGVGYSDERACVWTVLYMWRPPNGQRLSYPAIVRLARVANSSHSTVIVAVRKCLSNPRLVRRAIELAHKAGLDDRSIPGLVGAAQAVS